MLFGIATMIGGTYGYVAAGSLISLIAGIVAGLILILGALSMQKGSRRGLYTCLIVTLFLLAQFGRKFFFTDGKFMPAGLMSILSIVSLLLLVLILLQPAERKRIF
jgi:uncharacterized membrane protein (UPF0136 family)